MYSFHVMSCFLVFFKHLITFISFFARFLCGGSTLYISSVASAAAVSAACRGLLSCPQIEGLETKIAKNNNTTEAGNQTIYRHPYPSDNGILSKNQATLMKLMNQILEPLDFRRVKESSAPLQQPSTPSKILPPFASSSSGGSKEGTVAP